MTTQPELFEIRQAGNLTIYDTRLASGINQIPANQLQADPQTADFSGLPPPAPAPSSSSGQTATILSHLQSGQSITPLEALDLYGCFRLGARIWDIKHMGYEVKTEMVMENGKHFARYSLVAA